MSARAVPAPLAQIPNALTLARLALVPVFVVVLAVADGGHSWTAGVIFAVAGVTDQVDGFLARRWHVQSRFGEVADPLADRLMIDSGVILLVVYSRLTWVALAIIAARDLLLFVGWRVLTPRGIDLDVNKLGKAATWLLYLGLGCRMVTHDHTSWPLWIFWVGLGMAVVAAAFYVRDAWKALRA
jgi:CDP-diacylglycerol--glycerol-3-phosphate 3-phosphatidyltransferase